MAVLDTKMAAGNHAMSVLTVACVLWDGRMDWEDCVEDAIAWDEVTKKQLQRQTNKCLC